MRESVINWLSSTPLELEHAQIFLPGQVLYYAKYHRFEERESQVHLIKLTTWSSGVDTPSNNTRAWYRAPVRDAK